MWMWDRVNLPDVLERAHLRDVQIFDWRTSRILDWNEIGLDRGADGAEYKPESLYAEALR